MYIIHRMRELPWFEPMQKEVNDVDRLYICIDTGCSS